VVRGHRYTDLEWYTSQIKLLESHQYFTDSARLLSEDGQRRNLEAVRRLIHLLEENKHIDLDKLVILKSVNIFSAIPEEALVEAVELLEEVKVKSGQTIMEKGDHGSSMFIIADGKMLVHDGELTLNYLHRYDIFGEMAALDPQVRSASITAVEDTTLYKLDQKDLLYLVETQSAVTRGIFHILSQRLRNVMQDRADDFDYIQQFERVIAAAVALETGAYKPQMIDAVTKRTDELGQLARVFQRMAREVEAREDRLKKEVKELRIEIDKVKQARQVAEITDTEYFQELRSKVNQLREKRDSDEDK
jgi:CRP-like cAMP-binding protein